MSQGLPGLDRAALGRLRELLAARDGSAVPTAGLVELAGLTPDGAAVTIDYDAATDLGQPMVVLRVGAATGGSTVLQPLSPRQREVAELVVAGLRNREIAARLFITVGTVKDHVHAILERLELPSRAALIAAAAGTRQPAEAYSSDE